MAWDLIRRVEALGSPRLLVVGDLILDRYIWGDAERISQEAPVPLCSALMPANTVLAARRVWQRCSRRSERSRPT